MCFVSKKKYNKVVKELRELQGCVDGYGTDLQAAEAYNKDLERTIEDLKADNAKLMLENKELKAKKAETKKTVLNETSEKKVTTAKKTTAKKSTKASK